MSSLSVSPPTSSSLLTKKSHQHSSHPLHPLPNQLSPPIHLPINYSTTTTMGVEPAAANRSLGTIRTELEFLRDSGLLNPAQFQSIMSQLPVRISSPFLPPHRLRIQDPKASSTISHLATQRRPEHIHRPALRPGPQLRKHAAAGAGGAGPQSPC